MSVSASTQIPKTSDPAVFQRQCKALFEKVLNDPNVQEYGTSGQSQNGVDLVGRRRNRGLAHWVGVQCKLTIKRSNLPKSVIREEAEKALTFEPPLKEFIVVTTAPEDARLQAEANAITHEQAAEGRDFTVAVWGSQTLDRYILSDPDLLAEFAPDAFPHVQQVLQGQERLTERVEGQSEQLAVLVQVVRRMEEGQPARAEVSGGGVWDDRSIGTVLDSQIDAYRDMLGQGKTRTALALLERLQQDLPADAVPRIRFRVRANIAACQLQLGEEEEAAAGYLQAYDISPEDAKAPAFKVLGLLLFGDHEAAWEFGNAALVSAGDKLALIANMLVAARRCSKIENPLSVIPPDLEDHPTIVHARIDYLRLHASTAHWTEAAREARDRHPEDQDIAELAANAELAAAAEWADAHKRAPLAPSLRERLAAALDVLQMAWDRMRLAEGFAPDLLEASCANLATGYRLIGEREIASTVVDQGLQLQPDRPSLIQSRFVLALEQDDPATARRLMDRVPDCRDTFFGRLQLMSNAEDWAAVVALTADADLSQFDDEDRACIESLGLLARHRAGKLENPRGAVDDILARFPEQAIAPILLYEIPRRNVEADWAGELFRAGLERQAGMSQSARVMLARIAEREGHHDAVIDLLDGHVDLTHDSDDLRTLARAFVNGTPRAASIKFARALPANLRRVAFYSRVLGSIWFNSGDLQQAAAAFDDTIAVEPRNLSAHKGLINTWLRQDRSDLVRDHLQNLDPFTLDGSGAEKMELAQILVAMGRPESGLALGYKTALAHQDEPRVAQLYIGLILPNPSDTLIPTTDDVVGIDCAVHLRRSDGREMRIVIEEGADRQSLGHYSPSHPLARAVLEHRVDETVELALGAAAAERWCILNVKHKSLALLQEIMETFQTRFPEARGMHRIAVEGDDVTPVLDEVRRGAELQEAVASRYREHGFPLALTAAMLGRSAPEFAAFLVGRGTELRACLGTHDEREAALAVVREASGRGAVLDTYTAWTAHSLGIVPVLKATFARIVLPRSALDEFRRWRSRFEDSIPSGELLTIGYVDGQYVREHFSERQLRESADAISSCISEMERELEIVPAVAPEAPSPLEAAISRFGPNQVLDPVYVAVQEGLLVLSDDHNYRALAHRLHECSGAWLQAVLVVAEEDGGMSKDDYAAATAGLAARRHGSVTLNGDVLLRTLLADDTDNLDRLRAAARYLGHDMADLESHAAVCWNFISNVFDASVPSVRRRAAAGIVLERLVPLLHRHQLLKRTYLRMIEESTRPEMEDYLRAWARGHFLDLG